MVPKNIQDIEIDQCNCYCGCRYRYEAAVDVSEPRLQLPLRDASHSLLLHLRQGTAHMIAFKHCSDYPLIQDTAVSATYYGCSSILLRCLVYQKAELGLDVPC
jgi:hypothetical protein